ncbi:MAG TPA: serine/threonine-protein kinase [Polyangiaceae bacterium]|nr:serine/threonine-protein kinase [Polyangiaceae bacterium]
MSQSTGGGSGADSVDSLIEELAAAPSLDIPESRPSRSLAPGLQVGRYVLVRPLGQGGMGTVWEASHVVSKKHFALKVFRDDLPEKARRRFAREARLATAVHHPGVVEVHDCFEAENGSPVIVMELLQGETLGALLRRELPPPERAALIVADVVAIVRAAHAAGIVHRDLKPENIFLCHECSRGPRVRVLDFGIARAFDPAVDPANDTITQAGTVVGTPQYMAPEQLFGEVVDESADVWALGVILYECIKGSRPLEGVSVVRVARNLVRHGVPPLPPGSCPEHVRVAVQSMLAVERGERLRRLDEIELLLRNWAAGELPRGVSTRLGRWFAAAFGVVALAVPVARRARTTGTVPVTAPDAAERGHATAHADAPRLTVATEAPRTSSRGKLLDEWRRAIESRTAGRVAINLRWPGATGYRGGERALVTRLRSAQVDGALLGARGLRLAFPMFAAAELPGVVDSWQKVDWIRTHLREPLKSSLGGEGYGLVAFDDDGCERIMTRGHAVRRPADLRNLRMATIDNDPLAPVIASVVSGIVPVALSCWDVADAVAAGARFDVSMIVGTAADADRFQWTKVVDGVTRMPVLCGSGALIVRSSAYERLGAEAREAMDEVSLQLEEALSSRVRKEDTAASLRLLHSLVATEPSEDDRAAWRRAFLRAVHHADGSLPIPNALVTQVLALSGEIDALH